MKKQTNGVGERQMFCRLHNGYFKLILASYGRSNQKKADKALDKREEIEKSHLSIRGFYQPQPYINLHQFMG